MDSLGLQTINLQLIFDGSCVCVCVCFLRQGTLRFLENIPRVEGGNRHRKTRGKKKMGEGQTFSKASV